MMWRNGGPKIAPLLGLVKDIVCLVGEPRERSRADPRFGDGSNPSQVWL
jgi:hypothetical protein